MGNSYSDRFGAMVRWYNQRGPYPVLLAVLAFLLLIQAVRLVWLVLTPLGPVGDYRANDVEVLSPQSRLTLFSSFDPFFRGGAAQTANVVTSLQLTLFGIRMNEASGLGSAILAGPDGVQENYVVGEEIMSGVTAPVSLATAGNEIPGIASLAPRNEGGRVTGIVISPLGDGSLFKSAGFRDGDIIVSINGSPVGSTSDIEALKSQIKPGARLSVEVERGANTVPVAVNLGAQ